MLNIQSQETKNIIVCSLVSEVERVDFLPSKLGSSSILFETAVFQTMREYSSEYNGGYWLMWKLSNGAFYIAPGGKDETYSMSCAGNYFNDSMTADAAGIVSCLVALSRMLWDSRDDNLTGLFYGLRELALEHPERDKILAAID